MQSCWVIKERQDGERRAARYHQPIGVVGGWGGVTQAKTLHEAQQDIPFGQALTPGAAGIVPRHLSLRAVLPG